MLSPDEISEFAEAVDYACQEKLRNGNHIVPLSEREGQEHPKDCMCPLGALYGNPENRLCRRIKYPAQPPIGFGYLMDFHSGFINGYEHNITEQYGDIFPNVDSADHREGFALGRRFREQYPG